MDAVMMDGYTARLLPFAEWYRLGIDQERLPSDPERAIVLVVEDQAGNAVGHWLAYDTVVLEGLNIAESHRKKPGVAAALFHAMTAALLERHVPMAITLVTTPDVESLAAHAGMYPLPGRVWVLDLREVGQAESTQKNGEAS